MKITELNGYFYEFSVDYNIIDTSNINIHKYPLKKHDIKCLKLLKKSLLLTNIVNVSNHIKSLSLSNQKCEIQPALINLRPNE